jgi:hypothetical protein
MLESFEFIARDSFEFEIFSLERGAFSFLPEDYSFLPEDFSSESKNCNLFYTFPFLLILLI